MCFPDNKIEPKLLQTYSHQGCQDNNDECDSSKDILPYQLSAEWLVSGFSPSLVQNPSLYQHAALDHRVDCTAKCPR